MCGKCARENKFRKNNGRNKSKIKINNTLEKHSSYEIEIKNSHIVEK